MGLLRNPWAWGLLVPGSLVLVLLVIAPSIELAVSGFFFDAAWGGFPFRVHPLGEFARKTVPAILFVVAGLTALAGLAAWRRGRPFLGVAPAMAVAVVLSLALGPGLVVNVVLKENWGRARPSTIAQFAAPHQTPRLYTPALVIAKQCEDNCSFPSGHAALGFWTLSYALWAPPRRRRAAIAAALGFGGVMGLVRIAQGGHFLSDVVASGLIVCSLVLAIDHLARRPGRGGVEK